MPPGWRPAELGGRQFPKERDRATYRKFDTRVPRAVAAHVAVQFVLLLAVTTFFLFRQAAFGEVLKWAVATVILVWVMGLGLLLEGRRWAAWVEAVRALALGAVLVMAGASLPIDPLITAIAVTALTLAGLWWSQRSMPTALRPT